MMVLLMEGWMDDMMNEWITGWMDGCLILMKYSEWTLWL